MQHSIVTTNIITSIVTNSKTSIVSIALTDKDRRARAMRCTARVAKMNMEFCAAWDRPGAA